MALFITEEEAKEYVGLPKKIVAQRYMKTHRWERCGHCNRLIGNHSLKRILGCINIDEIQFRLKNVEPQEVPMIECPACNEWVPPAFACIKCGHRFVQRFAEVIGLESEPKL